MVTETEKQEFLERVSALKLNLNAIEEVRIHTPNQSVSILPNVDGKRMSLQIYAAITSNDGYINPESAIKGLDIFGEAYFQESIANFSHRGGKKPE